jgi:hypothetical protein
MVKKYNPVVKRSFDLWDDEYSYDAEMQESKKGEFVKLQTYNDLLKEHNKLKKKLGRCENIIRNISEVNK